ncbi:hypothetical protein [Calothrix sp. NIES-2100]|uniref:hypothetical protein n=1 Tax=Calothrix sp. NIES-2100 TaxID=1954172 RepID=UPI000BBBD38A
MGAFFLAFGFKIQDFSPDYEIAIACCLLANKKLMSSDNNAIMSYSFLDSATLYINVCPVLR